MAPPDLVAVGDVMVDVAVDARALTGGGHVQGQVRVRPGGSATNAAVWATAAGASATVVGRVGNDPAGRLLRTAVEERGVRALLATDHEASTGTVLAIAEGERKTIVADRGANALLSPADVPDRLEAGAVLVSGYTLFHPDSEPAARAALERAHAGWLAVDAASESLVAAHGVERFLRATEAASVLLTNEDEALVLTGEEPEGAARWLGERYQLACVKRGPAGAVAVLAGERQSAAAPAVEVVDPTGAGDAFDAVFLVALARGLPLASALAAACRAGALAAASRDPWPAPGAGLGLL